MAFEKLKKVWDVFRGRDPTSYIYDDYSYGSSSKPDRSSYIFTTRRSLVTSIYNRIAVDASLIDIRHVRLNSDGYYKEDIKSSLNYALNGRSNTDQTSKAFIRDLIFTLFDEGCAAIVPTQTDVNPMKTDSYDIEMMRVGKILEWYPYKVKLDLYREETGRHEQIILDKRIVPIVENPFYEIMNAQNSTLQRLMRTIGQLEKSNDHTASGKLDLIIQLPYSLKGDMKKQLADERKKKIEEQLSGSRYGIAYIDATEKVVQLNRSLENDLRLQVKDLQEDLYNQLGLTQSIFDGTANEAARLNYYNTTIEPILSAISDSIENTWLTKTARSQGQAIRFFRNPFKLIPVDQLAEISDKFTRNEIMTSNEIRSVIGLKPADDPKADQLRNSNLNQPDEGNSTELSMEELSKQINIPI